MKPRYKIPIVIAAVVLACSAFGISPRAASNSSLEGFVCANETKVLTPQQESQKQKRIGELEKAMSDTIGWRISGREIPLPSRGPTPRKLYAMQSKLSVEDWELLSEMFIEDYKNKFTNPNSKSRLDIISVLIAIRAPQAIAVLECKVDNSGLGEGEKADIQQSYSYGIKSIRGLAESPGFQLKYEKYRNGEQK